MDKEEELGIGTSVGENRLSGAGFNEPACLIGRTKAMIKPSGCAGVSGRVHITGWARVLRSLMHGEELQILLNATL